MHVRGVDIDLPEEMLPHEAVIRMDARGIHRKVLVEVEGHDVVERQAVLTMPTDEFSIHADRRRAGREPEHCLAAFLPLRLDQCLDPVRDRGGESVRVVDHDDGDAFEAGGGRHGILGRGGVQVRTVGGDARILTLPEGGTYTGCTTHHVAIVTDSRQPPSARLLALGAAAVLSIYGAGFERTRAAAAQLEAEDVAHQRPAIAPPGAMGPVEIAAASTATADAAAPTAERAETVAVATPAAAAAKVEAPPRRTEAAVVAVAATTTADTATATTTTAVTTTTTQTTAATDSASTTTTAKVAKWKDGTFSGWGNSRHGSIEATVTIVDGRITNAVISRCNTRYSCSWVEHLQGQVVARQSPEVDFVSGATQSANAFYYAVVEALYKAN